MSSIFEIFKKKSSSFLGVDIGTTGIKVVQLKSENEKIKLANYAFLESSDYLKVMVDSSGANNIGISDTKVANNLAVVLKKAEIETQKVVMSVPVSSAFSFIISLPDMQESEIPKAVKFEARQYIPIPMSEIVFGWSIVGRGVEKDSNNALRQAKKIKVLVVAIPSEMAEKYVNIATLLKLDLVALETESFSLARSLVGNDKGSFTIVDMGNKATSITIVKDGSVLASHSVSGTGGEEITKTIGRGLGVNFKRAEVLKKDVGLSFSGPEKKVSEIILPTISIIISEIKKMNEVNSRLLGGKMDKVIITGGSANLPGLVDYLSSKLGSTVEIGNPWRNIIYDKILSEKLKEASSYFSVAVGLALKGFEE